MKAYRLTLFVAGTLLLAGCAHRGGGRHRLELDETGGSKITRSVCPAVAIPAYTGDVSLFSPEQSRDARALDVTATITNLQIACNDTNPVVKTNVTFDVVAQRASRSGARDVVLSYFSTVTRGGGTIMSKQISQVNVHFDDGQYRGHGTAAASALIDKASASLPPNVAAQLNRRRKAGDADASVDPMTDPRVRNAVTKASFELLIGFQLTPSQLEYNATR